MDSGNKDRARAHQNLKIQDGKLYVLCWNSLNLHNLKYILRESKSVTGCSIVPACVNGRTVVPPHHCTSDAYSAKELLCISIFSLVHTIRGSRVTPSEGSLHLSCDTLYVIVFL